MRFYCGNLGIVVAISCGFRSAALPMASGRLPGTSTLAAAWCNRLVEFCTQLQRSCTSLNALVQRKPEPEPRGERFFSVSRMWSRASQLQFYFTVRSQGFRIVWMFFSTLGERAEFW